MSQPAATNWRLTARVHGHVQGVGFRFFVRRQASALGLSGFVRNLADGSVEAVAEGQRAALQQFLNELERGPIGADVERVDAAWTAAEGMTGTFQLRG